MKFHKKVQKNLNSLLISWANNPELNKENFFSILIDQIIMYNTALDAIANLEEESIYDKSLKDAIIVLTFTSNESNHKINLLSEETISLLSKNNNFQEVIKYLILFTTKIRNNSIISNSKAIPALFAHKVSNNKYLYSKLNKLGIAETITDPIDLFKFINTLEVSATASLIKKTMRNSELSVINVLNIAKMAEIFSKVIDSNMFGVFLYDPARQIYSLNARLRPQDNYTIKDNIYYNSIGDMYGSLGMSFPAENEALVSKDFLSLHNLIKMHVCT
jgi:hypothetical protein